MNPKQEKRYFEELSSKTRTNSLVVSGIALILVVFFYYTDINELELEDTFKWRLFAFVSALLFLIIQFFIKSPKAFLFSYALSLSAYPIMMCGIAFNYITFSDNPTIQNAVTIGAMSVWLALPLVAFGARRYLFWTSIVVMAVFLGLLIMNHGLQTQGYIVSVIFTFIFSVMLMRSQERQKRQESEYIYQLEERESQIATQGQELLIANENLLSFNFALSHDLKSPLRRAISFTQLLEKRIKTNDLESVDEFLDFVKSNHKKMQDIIESLMVISKIGEAALNKEKIDLASLVQDVIMEQLNSTENTDRIHIKINSLGEIHADATLLWHVLTNLISNAIKYSSQKPESFIEIGAYTENSDRVLFVQDNGTGFDMEYEEELGKPFKRLHDPSQFDGSGIGLTIVKRIMGLHQGRFWAKSVLGEGSTFFCAFPRQSHQVE
ncbi:MAG TPA: ATP-binding protein [Saprospiraceae bacterium]|nr:ATP-binding protein [Saprospiraceae bacterium]HMQ83973.1 ATP-binding protein [Saprospiraceae bacterium]